MPIDKTYQNSGPFRLAYGGATVKMGLVATTLISTFFIIALISGELKWQSGSTILVVLKVMIFVCILLISTSIAVWHLRGLIMKDPVIEFDGKDLCIIIGHNKYRCIDSNWHGISRSRRLRRSYVQFTMDKNFRRQIYY